MKLVSLALTLFLALVFWPQHASAQTQTQPKPEELAQKSAEAWLALTDSGKYAESWEQASSSFRNAVTKDGWVSQITPVRDPLGKVVSRKLASATYVKDPPNAPAGEYVVIRYNTDFENRAGSIETVPMVLDKDGKWRTAGYWIK
jgi:hypothetical protein